MLGRSSDRFPRRVEEGVAVPSGGGNPGQKNQKKKSKQQLEKELKRGGSVTPVNPMSFEIVKPKRKEKW